MTEIADIFKEVPYGIGGLMGGAIDAALGQKLSESTLLSINAGLESLFDTIGSVTNNINAAALLGESIAKEAKDKGIENVVFDRGGYLYHGRIKAVAEAARHYDRADFQTERARRDHYLAARGA